MTEPPTEFHLQRSSRDSTDLPTVLAHWLAQQLPEGADPKVTLLSGIDANGMSSETLILDVDWLEAGAPHHGEFVARVAPATDDVPVLPTYDLSGQIDSMRTAGRLAGVPTPTTRWFEETGSVLGTPFFLMDRIAGEVPPDVMPYPFGDNWLYDATLHDQRRLQTTTIRTIAQLHAIPDAEQAFPHLRPPGDGPILARNLAHIRDWHAMAARDTGPSKLIERALAWLEANLPAGTDEVLCWGDARIGNVLYRDFEPVGILDWEMATIGPRELDIAWLVLAHQVFEEIAHAFELPGMPHFLRADHVVHEYAAFSGVDLGDLTWFYVYAAVQWGIVFMRTGARQLHFGEIESPGEVEDLMHHRPVFERLLAQVGA